MKELKFRYVFKNKIFGNFSFYYLSLKEIENGVVTKILQSGMIENGYELISRDRYIGFKDRNGKEIYEADILLTDEAGWKAPVVWKRGGFILLVEKHFKDGGGFSTEPNWEKCEIVGNTHKNQKLLK